MRDQVSHPYTTTGTILLLHILIFVFLKGEREDKKILDQTVEGIPGVPSALNLSVIPVPTLTLEHGAMSRYTVVVVIRVIGWEKAM
jgi:hypothetical protein